MMCLENFIIGIVAIFLFCFIFAKLVKYVVNGRSAIEWIMESYRDKTDKDSGITDDQNTYGDEKYIFNLLISIIDLSIRTQDLLEQLPEYKEI